MSRADPMRARPVLVTGVHKSGTTWVGRTLGSRRGVGYIHEPFSLNGSAGICQAPIRHWYTYVCDENASSFAPHLERVLAFRYGVAAELKRVRSWRDLARLIRDGGSFALNRARKARPLVKDPLAALSSDWLARTFDMEVVVVVRHPVAFVGSLKIRQASHPFGHFLDQPLLMRDHLGPLEDEIRWMARTEVGPVEQGILLWRIIYSVLFEFGRRHPGWTFVRHEDLCADPVGEFGRLFERLGWTLDAGVRDRIARTSGLRGAGEGRRPSFGRDRFIYRRSQAARDSWKERLTAAEVRQVWDRTAIVAGRFYDGAARG